MRISLQNLHPRRPAPLAAVKRALKKLKLRPKTGVDIFFTDDREISRLHKEFLGIAGPTDVMSFPSDGPARLASRARLAWRAGKGSEIVISLDTAERQARERKIPLRWELTLLALHGILHALGFRDETLLPWKKMKIAEFESMVKII